MTQGESAMGCPSRGSTHQQQTRWKLPATSSEKTQVSNEQQQKRQNKSTKSGKKENVRVRARQTKNLSCGRHDIIFKSLVDISLLFVFVQAKSLLGGGRVPLQTRVQMKHKRQTLGYVSGYGHTVCCL